jgi:hypothetical protein
MRPMARSAAADRSVGRSYPPGSAAGVVWRGRPGAPSLRRPLADRLSSLTLSSFCGQLAIVLIGGVSVGTVLTLLVLPEAYVTFLAPRTVSIEADDSLNPESGAHQHG